MGEEPVFSEFAVANPESGSKYRVVIRGARPGDNFCTCPDFATNTLGTCKHVEFTLARLERKPARRRRCGTATGRLTAKCPCDMAAQREVRFLAGTQCPTPLAEAASKYFDGEGVLRPAAFARFEKFLSLSAEFDHDLRCNSDALAFVAEVRDREQRRRRIDEAFPAGIRSPALDKLLKADLYDYQREGAIFASRAGRCLVGDEMGLGKTIQALAAAEIMARHLGVERVLIVCPTSLKHQWEREISRFTERSARVIQGLRASRQALFASNAFFKITNYDTVHRDLDLIQGWAPDLVILDEAQRIKNWKTRAARSVKKIASPFAIVLTGTPLENRLEELVSIVQFVDQHRLGPTFRFLADHQLTDDVGKVIGYRDLDTIGKTLSPILIRRQKAEVAKQLPERLDKNFFVPMTPQQMVHHEENREVVARIVYKWRKYRFLSEADQRRLMIALQNMRMSCNSTYLLDQTTDHGVKVGELLTLLDEMFERPGTKVVIFSQWLRTHELIERRLKGGRDGHVLFHGGVPGPQAQGAGRSFPRGRPLPDVPLDRRRRRRVESAERVGGGQHGPAVEPGGARAAHRAGASAGPEPAGAGGELRRPGDDRRGDAQRAEVQEVAVRRRPGRRRKGSVPRRQPIDALHGDGGESRVQHSRLGSARAFGRRRTRRRGSRGGGRCRRGLRDTGEAIRGARRGGSRHRQRRPVGGAVPDGPVPAPAAHRRRPRGRQRRATGRRPPGCSPLSAATGKPASRICTCRCLAPTCSNGC